MNNGMTVNYHTLTFPDDFEICWVGDIPLFPNLYCCGSTDGRLRFKTQDNELALESNASPSSREAINGVAAVQSWLAVTTRTEIGFWLANQQGRYLPIGAHHVIATASGCFVCPVGHNGIVIAKPPFGEDDVRIHSSGTNSAYAYRVISLGCHRGSDILAFAARFSGIMAGQLSSPQEIHKMTTATFEGLDIVDLCQLDAGSLAVAALSREGTMILSHNVLEDRKPKKVRFRRVSGVAYRILSHKGDIYVLTSSGLFVLGNLAQDFIDNELGNRDTQILPIPMPTVDMNLAFGRFIPVVMDNEVRIFDASGIHERVPPAASSSGGDRPSISPIEPKWADMASHAESMLVA